MDGSLDVHMAQGPGRFQKLLLGNGGPGLYRAPGKGRAVEADRSREHPDGRQPLGQTMQINTFMLPPPPR